MPKNLLQIMLSFSAKYLNKDDILFPNNEDKYLRYFTPALLNLAKYYHMDDN